MSTITIGRYQFNLTQLSNFAAPLLIVMILAMMVLPLPPFMLDLLFTFNIGLSLIVMMAAMYTRRPLDFLAFPAILLLTTLLRLSLNVASTRVVLLHGHTGPDAAGKVIEAFGHFLVGGNFAVGVVVFTILVVINFVVITKGAGRIAEVSARFTLDAMPGKQMAIDADLNAGLIGEAEAKKRRSEIAQEAEFYGSMDGASKFVRGDAVAGILILFINIIGGLIVGMVQHDLSFSQASNNYILLAIGDGLVAQIPALIISVAAGLVVSRVGDGNDIGSQLARQLLGTPQVLILAGGVLGIMGMIPGMPHLAFLLLAAGLIVLGRSLNQQAALRAVQEKQTEEKPPVVDAQEASWDDLVPVDMIGLEVGYRLITLVDRTQDGDLLKRIKGLRKKFAQEMGFLPPAVHIRDNLELRPNGYRITIKGVVVGEAEVFIGQYMAINPGRVAGKLPGNPAKDPAFGLPAIWIEANLRDQAQALGYTVVDASTVVATHLSHLLQSHAATLLGRTEVQALIDHFTKTTPKLLEDLVPKLIPMATLQRVLQNLLDEGVHIRDLRTIVETLTEHAGRTQDPQELTALVRIALGRAIVQQFAGSGEELSVIVIEPDLERVLQQAMQSTANTQGGADVIGIEPGLSENLVNDIVRAAQRQENLGQASVLLVPDRLRLPMVRLCKRAAPRLRVLSHSEIPENRTIRVATLIGGRAG